MLSRSHVIRALQSKRQEFVAFESERLETRDRYAEYVQALSAQSQAGLAGALKGYLLPGALPTSERIAGQGIVRPFGLSWTNHEEAREWAMERLRGVRTVAVDGSQITPIPV